MNMGGLGPEVLVTLTTDMGKILTALHNTTIKGESHLTTALQIAGVGSPPLQAPKPNDFVG